MAAKTIESGEALECAYCFGNEMEMTQPRRLPCGHVYCLKCIEDDVTANKILQCPKCRQVDEYQLRSQKIMGVPLHALEDRLFRLLTKEMI